MKEYSSDLYKWMKHGSHRSAQKVVPEIWKIVQPKSVIDLGCGTGEWLALLKQQGAKEILGVDGPWNNKDLLSISPSEFMVHQLKDPLTIKKKFDLALCLEVVGHLPKSSVESIVKTLAELSDVVLLSAPIPEQKGVGPGPFFLQWAPYYVGLFRDAGFVAIDAIRPLIWNDPQVEWWFSQNMVFYVKESRLSEYPALKKIWEHQLSPPLPIVHPSHFLHRCNVQPESFSFMELLRALPKVFLRTVGRKGKRR